MTSQNAVRTWREAMSEALYGKTGFFRDQRPADHFRTSANSPMFATAITRLVHEVDAALGEPLVFDLVDIGAGRGELLAALRNHPDLDPELRERLRPVAVEIAERPAGLDPEIWWTNAIPDDVTGLIIAAEWLDNVPLDVAEDSSYVLVTPDGREEPGDEISNADRMWRDAWWPEGPRVEIGATRDAAWADAVGRLASGLALAIDYGHLRDARPRLGTLTGFRDGREVEPVPDGSCDITAHVAADAVAAAGSAVAGLPAIVVRQSEALADLGVSGARPDLAMAHTDPARYVRALAAASVGGELTDPEGLGGHFWIEQPVAIAWPV